MNDETYTTPEGFELYKSLLFPDSRRLEDVLTVDGLWDYGTMNHRNGVAPAGRPQDIEHPGFDKVIGRFMSTRNFPDRRGPYVVTPTQRLVDMVFPADDSAGEPFAFFDRLGFEAIYHEANDRVLIVAQASGIIASRWLAYVTPDSVPSARELASDDQ